MKNIVTLLGAGASIPFLHINTTDGNKENITTTYLTNTLLSLKTNKKVIMPTEMLDLIDTIYNHLKEIENKGIIPPINFEDIIYTFDAVMNFNIYGNKGCNSYFDVICKSAMSCFKSTDFKPNSSPFKQTENIISSMYPDYAQPEFLPSSLIRELIANEIAQAWTQSKDSNHLNLVTNYFKKITETYGSSHIFTLNYDPIIFECLSELQYEIGAIELPDTLSEFIFQLEYLHDLENVQLIRPYNYFTSTSNTIGFLHGNIGLLKFNMSYAPQKLGMSMHRPFENYIFFCRNYNKMSNIRLKLGNNNNCNHDGYGCRFDFPIFTGRDKASIWKNWDYKHYFHRFCREIMNADYLVIIGYSFGDDDINPWIYSFLNLPNKRLVIVDNSYDNLEKIEQFSIKETYQKIRYYLGGTSDFYEKFAVSELDLLFEEQRKPI